MCLGIPGEITEISIDRPELATVAVAGVRRTVNIGLIEDLQVGDWVLVHVGFAMSHIDEKEAALTLSYLEGMEQAYADELRALTESTIE